jgi:preprotein translocase subunit YajC
MINWEVILWTCVTLAVIMGVIGLILTAISAVNMKKRRKEIGDIHTTLAVGSKIMFAGGIYGKVVRMGQEEIIGVEIAPRTIIEISRFAVQAIVE